MWKAISDNPEDPKVVAHRKEQVARTKGQNFNYLSEFINSTCGNGIHWLDVGFANHSAKTTNIADTVLEGGSTHSMLASLVPNLTAIDIVKYEGYKHPNVTYLVGNITDYVFEKKSFDGIFAGAVLEHISDQEALLEVSKKLLQNDQSRLVITVPNPIWFIGLYDLVFNDFFSTNVDHISMPYPSALIELAERAGLVLESWQYVGVLDMTPKWRPNGSLLGRIISLAYRYQHLKKLPTSYNLLAAVFTK